MNRRLRIFLVGFVAAAIVAVWMLSRQPQVPATTADTPPSISTREPVRIPPESSAHGEIVTLPVATAAASLNSPDTTVLDDLSTLELLFSQYQKAFGGNPVGYNEEITAALLGGNSKRLAFLPAQGSFLDADGRLIDRWGTPYFFHALSGQRMEIVSAGPDRKHHTADDLRSEP